jgi:general secretion pathway protein I
MRVRLRRRAKGFTLIESLVALVIAAGVLAAFYQASASALQLRQRGDEMGRAALLAQSLVARLGAGTPIAAGLSEGRDDGFGWSILIRPAGEVILLDQAGRQLSPGTENLLHVRVAIARDDANQPLRVIETYRLDPAARQ